MTAPVDPIGDVRTLPGGQFIAACIGAVEQASWVIRHREEMAAKRGQVVDLERLAEAAALSAAAEMLTVLKADGDRAAAEGKDPPFLVKKAAAAGRATYCAIDQRKSAA